MSLKQMHLISGIVKLGLLKQLCLRPSARFVEDERFEGLFVIYPIVAPPSI